MADAISQRADLLAIWIGRRVPADGFAWFRDQMARLRGSGTEKALYLALGYAPRKVGKRDLELSREEYAAAQALSYDGDEASFKTRLEQLFRTADIGELIAFYRGLPLYPAPDLHVARAREGARSAMQPVFEAVAHRNPYPRERFDENAWNHMVLKALFIGSRLDPIQGLDERANPALMRMLCDYAHERWAAGRPISPELWRCVGPFADDAGLADLERILETGTGPERQAAALALSASPAPGAAQILTKKAPDLARATADGTLSWAALSVGAA